MQNSQKPTFGSARAYALHRVALGLSGGAHSTINKHINTGALRKAVRPDGLIDFAVADSEWRRNIMPPWPRLR